MSQVQQENDHRICSSLVSIVQILAIFVVSLYQLLVIRLGSYNE